MYRWPKLTSLSYQHYPSTQLMAGVPGPNGRGAPGENFFFGPDLAVFKALGPKTGQKCQKTQISLPKGKTKRNNRRPFLKPLEPSTHHISQITPTMRLARDRWPKWSKTSRAGPALAIFQPSGPGGGMALGRVGGPPPGKTPCETAKNVKKLKM